MDIQTGDRVTYMNETRFKILERIILDDYEKTHFQTQFNNKSYKLIKIERPKYEVIEEIEDISEYIEILENEYTAELNERYYYEEEYKIYRDRVRELEAELSKANNTINQYKEREQNLIKYLEKEITKDDIYVTNTTRYEEKYHKKAINLMKEKVVNILNDYREIILEMTRGENKNGNEISDYRNREQ